MPDLTEGLVYYVVFLFSTTLHEASHAWAAKLGGDLTAYHGGQVSLDPIPHIRRAPIGMVVLPIFTVLITGWPIGFASAPYDPMWAQRHPRRAGWMAIAGPAANLALILIAAIAINVGLLLGFFYSPESVSFGHVTASTAGPTGEAIAFGLGAFFSLNLVLFTLNLLPIPPLDGSGALLLVMPEDLIPKYQSFIWSHPALAWIGILVAWRIFDALFNPVFVTAVSWMYPGVSYVYH